ncbi:MAG: hypothetical protein V7746_01780 [Halioglobus sp.]
MFKFLKEVVFNGLLIIFPVLFLIIIIKEFIALIIGLATPIADLFPRDLIEGIPETEILAALLILAASFIVGIIAKLPPGRAIGRKIERYLLNPLPVYAPLKSLLNALLGAGDSEGFKPAFIIGSSGELEPAYIIEDTGRPRLTVLIPWTPTSFAGSIKLVPRDQVHAVDLTFDAFSLCIGHYGMGLSDLIPVTPDELVLKTESEAQ